MSCAAPARLPPVELRLSLPSMSAEQADKMLNLIDTLQMILWETYGDAVLEPEVNYLASQLDADGSHLDTDDLSPV